MSRYDSLGPSSRVRRTWPLWVPGLILACYILTYVPSTVGQMSRRWEIRSEIKRLKVQRWTKHLHITDQQLECCASEVQSQDLEDMHILEILLLAAKHEGQKTFVELGALMERRSQTRICSSAALGGTGCSSKVAHKTLKN